jgi:hypothetical protein
MEQHELPLLLTEAELAKHLRVTPGTLANQRSEGRSPIPYIKVGRQVRYRRNDVLAFEEGNLVVA